MSWSDFLFGRQLRTEEDEGERVGAAAGASILGLDALASAAYGPEALLTVLLPLGAAGARYLSWLTAITLALLLILYVSYRQTIDAYPNGGGAYTVAKENLGESASLLAGAALALDYLLNVAVAISAGVGALVSAIPVLLPHTVALCLLILFLLMMINLRGVRVSGFIFLLPTYAFVACLFVVIGIGAVQTLIHGGHPHSVGRLQGPPPSTAIASFWLLCRAFANGCTAMTGVEAVSNGVPIFREPREVGAKRTLSLVIATLAVLLVGIAGLTRAYGISATPPGTSGYRSLLSELTEAVAGRGLFYYVTLGTILTLLSLSANTSFADFPRLCRMLAADRFLPEPLTHRGRRLAFSHGIFVLTGLSGLLLVLFGGVTDALIPLFAVGALSAFTASQAGMVVHWRKKGRARHSLVLNAVGAVATGLTTCVVLLAKFTEGAWISLALVLAMLALFRLIRRHYDFVARVTATDAPLDVGPARESIAVLPIRRWDAIAVKGLKVALSACGEVIVVQVIMGDREVEDLSARWSSLVEEPLRAQRRRAPRLVVLRSAYRQVFEPLFDFLKQLIDSDPERQVSVVIPELVERRWYQYFLHGQSASLLKAQLLYRGMPGLVIVSSPWYLRDWLPERKRLFRRRKRS